MLRDREGEGRRLFLNPTEESILKTALDESEARSAKNGISITS